MSGQIIAFPAKRIGLGGYGQRAQSDPLDYPNEGEIYLLPAPIERRPPNLLELWNLSILFWASLFVARQ